MESVNDFRRMTKLRECVFGLVGDGFVIVAADASTGYNFTGDNTTEDKITVLDSHKLVAAVGFPADRSHHSKEHTLGFHPQLQVGHQYCIQTIIEHY
ncbi:unnamed protein product [Cuscuta campestris]|uniref:Proteasome subunit beta n=1 Tax=Cuscuta campestris TaxID=132261 RepID=A0A484MTC1_9ASTE|nr:unnamed protein product [Cuscuta campestris]